jgi:Uma2 family endonuclease
LCLEIVSPSNTRKKLKAKTKEYCFGGVKMVWIIDPELHEMLIFREPDTADFFDEEATVVLNDVLPGFRCKVADFLN